MMSPSRRTSLVQTVAVIIAVVATASCMQKPASNMIAQVGDSVITKDSFEAELVAQARKGRPVSSPADRENVLNEMIRLEVFFAKAKAAGYDRDPELMAQIKRMVAAKYEEREWVKAPAPRQPEAGEIELLYRRQKDQFTHPEKVHVAVLFLKAPGKVGPEQLSKLEQRVEEMRRQAVEQAAAQPDFGLLAQENSEDQATRYRGGDCGWITRPTLKFRWEPGVLDAMFALEKPGEITPVIRAADGFYLGKLIERKAAETAPLEQVRERIERQLTTAHQAKAKKDFDTLQKTGMAIQINRTLLEQTETPKALAKKTEIKPPILPAQ
jgi:parvulin-like peptidyl-prolyl isomerase